MDNTGQYGVDQINRDNCWMKGDSVAFFCHGFLRTGFITGTTIYGDYIGAFNVDLDKPISEEMMSLFVYGKDRRVQHTPLRGNIHTARVLLIEKTLWPFKANSRFGM